MYKTAVSLYRKLSLRLKKSVLYVYFELSFIQRVDTDTEYEEMKEIQLIERVN